MGRREKEKRAGKIRQNMYVFFISAAHTREEVRARNYTVLLTLHLSISSGDELVENVEASLPVSLTDHSGLHTTITTAIKNTHTHTNNS